MSDTWLCFPPSIILIVKQNDFVKDKNNFCLKPAPGNTIVASVKIKIATVEFPPPLPPPPPKKKKISCRRPKQEKKKKKSCRGSSGRGKKNPGPHTFLMVRPLDCVSDLEKFYT